MKLPWEPLMGDQYYWPHAYKAIERERSNLEAVLNQGDKENHQIKVVTVVSILVSIVIFVMVLFITGWFFGMIASVVMYFLMFVVGSGFVERDEEKEEVWKVSVGEVGRTRGGAVDLICEKYVEGEIVEKIFR